MHRWALLVGALVLGGCAASNARSPSPSVVWSAGHTAYVASRVGGALAVGDSIEFIEGRHTVAAGRVASLGQGEMATVAISSGDFAGVKDLKHVTVRVHRPALTPIDRLRLGFPSAKRGTAFFTCRRVELSAPAAFASRDSGATTIFTRDSSSASPGPWPRRLDARRFDDVADEEIALERGEIDVAIFWPGELSTRLRKDPRWSDFAMGMRSRGTVAVEWTGREDLLPVAAEDVYDAVNRDAFRNDLVLTGTLAESHGDSATLATVRFEVDPRCPGHREIQRILDRVAPARTPTPSRHARLFYLDQPHDPDDWWGGQVVPIFDIRCPVVSAPELRAYVHALSPDSLVNMIDCKP